MIRLPEHIKAVLFDLDGTLVDSMGMWKQIDIDFLGRYQVPMPENLQMAIEGKSFRETAQYFADTFDLPLTADEMMETWNEMAMDAYSNTVPMKEGAMEFLDFLKRKGIPMGIVTSNSPELLYACLDGKKLRPYFDVFVDGKQVKKGKPAPDGYLEGARLLGIAPENCLVFEDIPQGIIAGKRAGMTVYAMYDAYSVPFEKDKHAYSDAFLSSFFEIDMEE